MKRTQELGKLLLQVCRVAGGSRNRQKKEAALIWSRRIERYLDTPDRPCGRSRRVGK